MHVSTVQKNLSNAVFILDKSFVFVHIYLTLVQERNQDISSVTGGVNDGLASFSNWSTFMCTPEDYMAITRIRGPLKTILSPFKG